MSGYESPRPESEIDGDAVDAGAMGAGGAAAPDMMANDGGDAMGGGAPGDPDAMGADGSLAGDDDVDLEDLP
jgi:hypothetical protein